MKIKKCTMASFHYKQQAISITKDIDNYIAGLDNYYRIYYKNHLKHKNDYLEQLDMMCENWDAVKHSEELRFHFIANVYVLTTFGIIKNDEYNGMNFIYELET